MFGRIQNNRQSLQSIRLAGFVFIQNQMIISF